MMMMSSCRGDSWIDRTSKSVLTFQLISFRVRLLRFSLGDSPEPTPRPVPGLDEMREGKCGKSNSSSNGLFIHFGRRKKLQQQRIIKWISITLLTTHDRNNNNIVIVAVGYRKHTSEERVALANPNISSCPYHHHREMRWEKVNRRVKERGVVGNQRKFCGCESYCFQMRWSFSILSVFSCS